MEFIQWDQPDYDYKLNNSRSILARIAQSYELAILMPVIQLAISEQFNSRGFTVVTWLHDGFCFDAHDKRDVQAWKNQLFEMVTAKADEIGIYTELEYS